MWCVCVCCWVGGSKREKGGRGGFKKRRERGGRPGMGGGERERERDRGERESVSAPPLFCVPSPAPLVLQSSLATLVQQTTTEHHTQDTQALVDARTRNKQPHTDSHGAKKLACPSPAAAAAAVGRTSPPVPQVAHPPS